MRKQKALPGLEKKTVKELDDAAETYVDARDERMKLTEKETDARAALIAVMKKHDLLTYKDESVDPPLIVVRTPGEDKVKVRKETDDDGDFDVPDDVGQDERPRARGPGLSIALKEAGAHITPGEEKEAKAELKRRAKNGTSIGPVG